MSLSAKMYNGHLFKSNFKEQYTNLRRCQDVESLKTLTRSLLTRNKSALKKCEETSANFCPKKRPPFHHAQEKQKRQKVITYSD